MDKEHMFQEGHHSLSRVDNAQALCHIRRRNALIHGDGKALSEVHMQVQRVDPHGCVASSNLADSGEHGRLQDTRWEVGQLRRQAQHYRGLGPRVPRSQGVHGLKHCKGASDKVLVVGDVDSSQSSPWLGLDHAHHQRHNPRW